MVFQMFTFKTIRYAEIDQGNTPVKCYFHHSSLYSVYSEENAHSYACRWGIEGASRGS